MEREERQSAREIDLSIVLPVYNEESNLVPLDSELRSVLRAIGKSAEIIYVDDFSRDGSRAVLERLVESSLEGPIRTRVIRFRRNYGQTAAMTAGFQLAEGRVIIPLDADGQNNPADIPRLLAELEKGYDVVSGWRKNRQDKALSRKLPSRVANWLIGLVSGVRLHDHGCTLKAYRASLLKELHLYGEMHRFIPLYLNHIGARVGELPVQPPSADGRSQQVRPTANHQRRARRCLNPIRNPLLQSANALFWADGTDFLPDGPRYLVLHGGLQVRLAAANRDRLQGQLR